MGERATLLTDRLELSPLSPTDADDMVGVLADPRLYEYTGGAPPNLAELRDLYERQAIGHSPDGAEEWHNWIVRRRADRRAVGYVQATVTDREARADVAWVIGFEFQGAGYATEAARAVLDWLRDERGVVEVGAHIHPAHEASNRVAERIGLRPTDELDEDGERVWMA